MDKGLAANAKPLFYLSMLAGLRLCPMAFLHRFLRFFFWHFYHGFAWTYDGVAALVSLGRWNDWLKAAVPFVRGSRVLEIGHGPGHLQVALNQRSDTLVFGLDESAQMARMAQHRLRRSGCAAQLARGLGQALPYASGSFDTVTATFPTEYIFEQGTLIEVGRVLRSGGRFVVVPAAWIVGRKAIERAAAWLFRVTDQAPRFPAEMLAEKLRATFEEAGFSTQYQAVELRSSTVLIIVAELQSIGDQETTYDQASSRTG